MMDRVSEKLLVWGSEVDSQTREQAARAARLPFVAGHVALMPDAHVGIGATVGSVIPTEGAIIPAAVGVDIGCGMVAGETDLCAADLPDDLESLGLPRTELTDRQHRTVRMQFGTLGSGNHFVEVCLDERDRVWTVLHSGSRGIGSQLAQMHIATARKLAKHLEQRLEDLDLAYFLEG